jgi:hypothetical protein
MLFSDAGRAWKILGALLLFYAGGLYNHMSMGAREMPVWSLECHPERAHGRSIWLYAERILEADPVAGTITVEPKGYRVVIHAPAETFTAETRPGGRLYGRLRYDRDRGFLLDPDARTTVPQRLPRLDLVLASLPALLLVGVLLLKHFRSSLAGGIAPREEPHA